MVAKSFLSSGTAFKEVQQIPHGFTELFFRFEDTLPQVLIFMPINTFSLQLTTAESTSFVRLQSRTRLGALLHSGHCV